MNSSKEWGDSPNTAEPTRGNDRRPLRQAAFLGTGVVGLLFLVVAIIFGPRLWSDPAAHAGKARAELKAGLAAIETGSYLHSVAAEKHALAALNAGSGAGEGYLLASSAVVMRKDSESFSIEDEQKLEDYTNRIDVPNATSSDMYLGADVAFQFGDLNRSDWYLRELLVRDLPEDLEIKTLKLAVKVRFDKGADDDAKRHAQKLAELAPSDCLSWTVLSYLAEDENRPEAMIDAYRELLKRNCGSLSDVRLKLLEQLIVIGDNAGAREQFELLKNQSPEVLEQKPELNARILLQEGKVAEASAVVDQILKQSPKDPAALVLSAQLALGRNEPAPAVEQLKAVVEADPANTQAMYLLGQAYARNGQKDEARKMLQRQSDVRNAKVQLHRMERHAGANPKNAQIRHEIAREYYKLGYIEKAKYWREAALALEK